MSSLHHLVYVSAATTPMGRDELLQLLAEARENNTHQGITGLLLYRDGDFMQLLEGDRSAVSHAYQKILRDSRHKGVITLINEPAPERLFAQWSMAFADLTDPAMRTVAGYSPFMERPLRGLPEKGLMAMLASFRDQARISSL